VKHFRHQPLLVWSLSLVLLLGVVAVGANAAETPGRLPSATPTASSGYPYAQEILRSLPGAHAALAVGELESWGDTVAAAAGQGREADDGTGRQQRWDDILLAVSDLTAAATTGERAVVIERLDALGRLVMELNRSYR
jgi:hypothetical protein